MEDVGRGERERERKGRGWVERVCEREGWVGVCSCARRWCWPGGRSLRHSLPVHRLFSSSSSSTRGPTPCDFPCGVSRRRPRPPTGPQGLPRASWWPKTPTRRGPGVTSGPEGSHIQVRCPWVSMSGLPYTSTPSLRHPPPSPSPSCWCGGMTGQSIDIDFM